MNELSGKIESMLFVAAEPLSFKKLASLLNVSIDEVAEAATGLAESRNVDHSGIHVVVHDKTIELVSNPGFAEIISPLVKQSLPADLTAPQLETLTIVAYRGPLTRLEIEQIRGVNCQVILRNLLVRGLIEEREGDLVPLYQVTLLFLKTLGVRSLEELPNYEAFHTDEQIQLLLDQMNDQ